MRGRPPSFPTPTWLSRRCIHRWHGCGRAVHRARRLRASCRRTSRKCPLGMFPKGRLHRCLCGYHTLRGHTGRLQEKVTGCSGLGGPFPVGTQYCGGWGLSLPPPRAVESELGQTQDHQNFSEDQGQPWRADCSPPPRQEADILVPSVSSVYLCVGVEEKVVCDVAKRAKEPNFQLFCGWRR